MTTIMKEVEATPMAVARFWSHVETSAGCWLWKGWVEQHGYGQWAYRHFGVYKKLFAHRVAYELIRGPIPDGLTIDHLCRVHNCVNPEHLEAVTSRENILRGESFAARQARQTHCKWGHEFTSENTYVWPGQRSYRGCRECRKINDINRRQRLAAAS